MTEEIKEGWGFPGNCRKAHYFKADGRSLCRKWGSFRISLEQGNDDSPDNCTVCMKALPKHQAKSDG
ncbi:hypothetical protein LCGC14_1672900 [marine sediment metagenome]|uniref:Uncharacterized protein n=1 Tax=marine sediment metagenome TaxID=412755 RepID=A0A0F9HQU0_9ZZZZ